MTEPDKARLGRAAIEAFAKRDWANAHAHASALARLWPDDPNANQVLGLLALERGDPAAARLFLERAIAAAPNQAPILNSLAVARRRAGDISGAREAFARAAGLGLVDAWRNLGSLEEGAGQLDAAIEAYGRVLTHTPHDAVAHGALAGLFEGRHDLPRARAHAEYALASDPMQASARIALARIHLRDTDFMAAEAAVRPLAQSERALDVNKAIAWGLIGQARDRLDDAAGAFAAYTSGNQILLRTHAALLAASDHLYHPDSVGRMIDLVERGESGGAPADDDARPVFLIGFPRSGTTLLDQVLSSHTRLACIEEQAHFARAVADVLGAETSLERAVEFDEAQSARVRRRYRDLIGAAQPGVTFIDKLPLNIVALPLIAHIFPNAKIILALRDPRDVILSCYQQQFGMNAAMVQFLSLETAAGYYDLVMTLLAACRRRLALNLHQVRYEDVVANLEGEARKLTAFLDVPFEPRMLAYQETAFRRDIQTPSARQVVQPLYTRSIGRWRRYAAQLAPVAPTLNPWADQFGYAP